MTAQAVQEVPEATQEFVNLILAAIDPDLFPAPANLRFLSGPFQKQQARMLRIAKHKTQETARTLRQQMFYLSPGALRTLDILDISTDMKDQVRSLNLMFIDFEQHAINDRLKIIAAIPPTRPGHSTPDWTSFWTQNLDSHIGVCRPQDHDPLQDPVSETLNRIILAIARQAVACLPSPPTLASHILSSRKKGPAKPLRLSEVYIAALRSKQLAQRLGLQPEDIQTLTPEQTLAQLRAAGLSPQPDIGTLGTLQELRASPPETGIDEITASLNHKVWYKKCAPDSWVLHSDLTNPFDPPPEQTNKPSLAERVLIRMTVCDHPAAHQGFTNSHHPTASAIAYVNRTTPEAVIAYLQGATNDPEPAEPRPCPSASVCATPCGRIQHLDNFPRPLNFDGRYESCYYHHFLTLHQDSSAELRESAAALQVHTLQKQAAKLKKANPEHPAAPQPPVSATSVPPATPHIVQPNLL